MTEPGDPSPFQRQQYERLYQEFCREYRMDPEETQTAIRFEEWWQDWLEEIGRK